MKTPTESSRAPRMLSTTLATAFFSFSVVVLLLYASVDTFSNFKIQETSVISQQEHIAHDAAEIVRSFIHENFNILEAAIWLTDLDAGPEEKQERILQNLLGHQSTFRHLVLLNARKQILAQSSRLTMEALKQYTARLKDLLPEHDGLAYRRTISPVYFDPATSEPMTTLAVPVTNVFGDFKGTLIAEVNLKFMWDIVDQVKVGETGYMYVSDRKGNLLAFEDTARVLKGENVSHLKAVADFVQNHDHAMPNTATRYRGIRGSTVLGTYTPLEIPDWAVVAEMPWKEAYRETIRDIEAAVGITLALAILAGFFGRFMAKRLAVPVINLTETATRIAAGERNLQAAVGGPREVVRLAVAFNSMTAQLRHSLMDLEQRFAEMKRTEEAFRLSEERLRLALEGTSDGIWDWNLQTGQVYFSPRYYTMMGYDPFEFPPVYESWRQLLHPEDLESSERAVQRAIEEQSPFAIEFRFRTKNGQWCWILSRGKVVESDASGKAARVAGSHTDITERKQAEKALHMSAEQYRAMTSTSMDGYAIVDTTGCILDVNEAYSRMIGYSRDELLKMSVSDIETVNTPKIREKHQKFMAGSVRFESRHRCKDGRIIDVEISMTRLPRSEKILVFLRDITDRKQAEEALRKYERIVSTSQDLMALINCDYMYEAVNESMLKAHNRSRREVVGSTVPEVIGESVFRKRIQPRLDKALSGQTVHFQELVDYKGFGRRIMDVSYFPMFDKTGKVEGAVLNARDITETKKLEEQLIQSQKIDSIGTLAGGVAHEINNPITGIMNYAQLILDQIEEEGAITEFAQEILHETHRIADIVRNLLTFARYEKQSHTSAQFSDIVSSVLSLVKTVLRHDQIDLQLEIPDSLPDINCRSQQIQQVLINLITNARDALNERYPGYSPEKKLRLSVKRIEKQRHEFVRATVEDSGAGIHTENLDRIFDPFFTTKPKETGTGLGLSISYGIVRDHGGELGVESQPGRFTRFHMDLPVDKE